MNQLKHLVVKITSYGDIVKHGSGTRNSSLNYITNLYCIYYSSCKNKTI